MSILRVAAQRATPVVARASRQQARWGSTGRPGHFDPFELNPKSKWQTYAWFAAMVGALSAPVFAIRYQLAQYKYDKRSFGG